MFADRNKLVVVISGRKQSGKDTTARGLAALTPAGGSYAHRPFAGPLKEFCVTVLGVSRDMACGTDADKNTLTHLLWERAPNYFLEVERAVAAGRAPRTGPMRVRDVLQWWGTEVVRYHDPEAWTRAWMVGVCETPADVIFCTDCRFPNEVDAARRAGAFVVRLLRAPHREDEHESEKALDGFPFSGFDLVVDNARQTPEQTLREVVAGLRLFRPGAFPPAHSVERSG